MRTLRLATCLAAAAAAVAAASTQTPDMTKMPPLIDRQHFFGDPEISGAQISPDGAFIAFLRPYQGTRNIWVKRTAEPFDKARPVTADTKRPIPGFFWSRDGKFLLYVQDEGGDENYNVHAVNPAASPGPGSTVPASRNLTDAKGVRAAIFWLPKSDADAIYVGLNDRDPAWHDVYALRLSTGERRLVLKNTERLTGVVFDLKDRLRMVTRSAENGDTEFLRAEEGGRFTPIYTCNVFETCEPLRFHKDGRRLYVVTNKGAGVDLIRLALLDVETGREEVVESDPEGRVDLDGARFSEKTDELIVTAYEDERTRLYWKDKAFEADYAYLQEKLGDKEVGFASSTRDEQVFLVSASSDVEPGEMYLFRRGSRDLTLQYRIREQLPRQALVPMKPVRYASSDGLAIPAYLTLPAGVPARGLPAVVVPHGGPWARDTWGYNPLAQYLANRGYAVLMPNFRGSTGYGKRFLDAGNRQWGDKMQDDITWGVKYLVSEGIADPRRLGILGGSYGGYATLAGVAFTPDVYAAGVSIVGPSNLITLLDSIPPYWEAGRKIFHERMGDPSTAEGRQQLERQSPLNHAGKIRTPLLVIQGANDPRVNKNESDQIVVALRDRGFPVEYLVAPDEGHGFARPVNNLAAFAAAERFLARHLGGRNQADMAPDVAARLGEITVDPKTVTLRKAATAGKGTPKPAAALRPGTLDYRGRVELGGESVEMSVSTEIREEDGGWVVTETAKSPMGDAVDRTVLDKASLALRQRRVSQGPLTIEMTVRDGKATGEVNAGGQPRPFSVDLGGELFADGGGAYQVAATLPLEEGYVTAFRNLDLRTQKPKVVELKVVGLERVSVPAGSFDTVRARMTSDDGAWTTIWVDRASHTLVKLQASSPAMAGATMTTELVK